MMSGPPEGAGSDTESDYLNKKGVEVTKRDEEYQELMKKDLVYTCGFQFYLYCVAIFSGLLQGYQIGIIAGTELSLSDEYGGIDIAGLHNQKPSTKDRELFVSNYALGGVLGAIFGSVLSDWVGRKWTGIIGDAFIALGFIIIILADGILVGTLGRITSGFGQGLQNFAIPLYLNEVGTNKYNKIISAYYTLMIGGGMIFGLNLSIPFRHDWKFLYEIGLIEAAVLAVFIFLLPESQVFFMNNDQDDEAKKVVLRGVENPEDADWYMR